MEKKREEILEFGGLKHYRHINPDGSVGGWVSEKASIGKNVIIGGKAIISGETVIHDNAFIFGQILTKGKTEILSGAVLKSNTLGSEYWLFENCIVWRAIQKYWPKRCR